VAKRQPRRAEQGDAQGGAGAMGPTSAIKWKAKPLTRREIRASIRIVLDAFSSSRATVELMEPTPLLLSDTWRF
jgi:hypothetical protein